MAQSIIRVILCFVIIALVGCTSHELSVKRADDKVMCKSACQQRFNTCSQVCHNNCRECGQHSAQSTAKNYRKYKHQQCIQGGIIARDLNSYRDPLQCRKITCDCLADYNVCTEACDGIIHKRLQIAPICC